MNFDESRRFTFVLIDLRILVGFAYSDLGGAFQVAIFADVAFEVAFKLALTSAVGLLRHLIATGFTLSQFTEEFAFRQCG